MDRALVSGTKGLGFDPRVALQSNSRISYSFAEECDHSNDRCLRILPEEVQGWERLGFPLKPRSTE